MNDALASRYPDSGRPATDQTLDSLAGAGLISKRLAGEVRTHFFDKRPFFFDEEFQGKWIAHRITPLVNTAGQVIGIDTAASQGTQAQNQQTQAFAIPINRAVSIAGQIEARNSSATVHIGPTAFLGVAITSASDAAANGVPAGAGASVAGTVAGAPAASAGLAQGDVIISVNGQRISSPEELQSALGQHHPGDSVTIGWQDATGQAQSATVTLANGPAA